MWPFLVARVPDRITRGLVFGAHGVCPGDGRSSPGVGGEQRVNERFVRAAVPLRGAHPVRVVADQLEVDHPVRLLTAWVAASARPPICGNDDGMTPEDVRSARFHRSTFWARGYDEQTVDELLDRIEAALRGQTGISRDQLVNLKLAKPPFPLRGYRRDDVDEFIKRVIAEWPLR
jgi:DivIVA domain-containing protein